MNINKIKGKGRQDSYPRPKIPHYYSRPSLPDIAFEERYQRQYQSAYGGKSIYEWNIDGASEYEIMSTLTDMCMAATAYKANNTSDKETAKALTSGFSGQLKGWWEFYLTEENRQTILNSKKKKSLKAESTSTTPMLIEEEDAMATLVYTIAKSFIGNPEDSRERASEILSNLTCPKLQDFQWYKDMFLTKVMLRTDSQKGYWKSCNFGHVRFDNI